MADPGALHPLGPDLASVHGTGVSLANRGLLIIGPSGSGKSGLAAQLIVASAELVSDDMVYVRSGSGGLEIFSPPKAPHLIELRGLGLVPWPLSSAVPLVAVLSLVPSTERLPHDAWFEVHGRRVPLLRHPYQFDLAAKVRLWMDAA